MEPPLITSVAEYAGEPAVRIAATQLEAPYTATQAKRIVAEWVEFFSAGPSPIRELALVSRVPKRLFAALAGQTQLERLFVKWGDYADLSALAGMRRLELLCLAGASSVESVEPLAPLTSLARLEFESLKRVHDLSPLAALTGVTDLELGGDWASPRMAHIDSIGFLREMPQLRRVVLHTLIVDDKDYSPLLDLRDLREVFAMKTRGMRPSHEELIRSLPWRK